MNIFGTYRHYQILCALLIIVFLPSCMRRISVTSTSFANKRKIPYGFSLRKSFAVVPPQGDSQLFINEVGYKIETILEDNGYRITNPDDADYHILFDFGMDASNRLVSRAHYIPGQTKVTYGNRYHSGIGYGDPFGLSGYHGHDSYQEVSETPGSIVYVPEEITIFDKHITVTVYDASTQKEDDTDEQLWHAIASSSGENDDLREIVNYLLKAIFKDFGHNAKRSTRSNWY